MASRPIFDDAGNLKIIDRAKDVGKLNDGSLFAPKYIENKLKFFQYIREAVVFGHQRDFATAFINIDYEAVGNWAERRNISYGGYQELAANTEVLDLIQGCLEQVNADLAVDRLLRAASREHANESRRDLRRGALRGRLLHGDDGQVAPRSRANRFRFRPILRTPQRRL